jgi:hypothetical protein
MKKEDKEIEQILLNDDKYEQFIKTKTEKEFLKALEEKTPAQNVITDIKQVPKDKLFCAKATYLVINKTSKTQSYINGIQAESYLVSLNDREKLLEGIIDSFVYGDYFIKFYKLKA